MEQGKELQFWYCVHSIYENCISERRIKNVSDATDFHAQVIAFEMHTQCETVMKNVTRIHAIPDVKCHTFFKIQITRNFYSIPLEMMWLKFNMYIKSCSYALSLQTAPLP